MPEGAVEETEGGARAIKRPMREARILVARPSMAGIRCEIVLDQNMPGIFCLSIGDGTPVRLTPQQLRRVGELMEAISAAWGRDA